MTPPNAAYIDRLANFIRQEYLLEPLSVTPAKRGYFGETWKLCTAESAYFLKLDYTSPHKTVYANSFPVLEHLWNHGIDFVSRIVKSKNGELYTCFSSAVVGVFAWIDGENIQNEQTKPREYQMLARVYAIPPADLRISRDVFSAQSAELFFAEWTRLREGLKDDAANQMLALFEENELKIRHRAERLALFADRCKPDTSHFYITHGDAGGNLVVNGDKFFIVDWEEARYAPPERDGWFCLHWDWAMDAFHNGLRQSGIDYTLRPERLAYYCYHMFFWYMFAYLATYAAGNDKESIIAAMTGFFSCWIEDNLLFADTIL